MPERALIAEPEPSAAAVLTQCFSSNGYGVSVVDTGVLAIEETQRQRPDLLVTDISLPDVPGTDVCRRIRADAACARTPILVLTRAGDVTARIEALESGADDVLGKPFSPREIVLRARALLRRAQRGEPHGPLVIRVGVLEIDVPRHRVYVAGQEIQLTRLEFQLALFLASEPGRVRTRAELLEQVWGTEPSSESRTVDTHIKRLREKLGPARHYLGTVLHVGYRLEA